MGDWLKKKSIEKIKVELKICDIGTTKSERSAEDSVAENGIGCTDVGGRALAAFGGLTGVESNFLNSLDVKGGGILLVLPFLNDCCALDEIEKYFPPLKGFYSLDQIFLILIFMALSRVKNPEQLRKISPGEWGKCLGIDRIPESKTLRNKIKLISNTPGLYEWSNSVTQMWLNDENSSGIILVDGHVRTYYGEQTALPKRFKTGRRLCLSSMMDYYVNDITGAPFFVVTTASTSGMTKMIKEEIVPKILQEFKGGPSEEELEKNKELHKFLLVYDRESYGYQLMYDMRTLRIACQTYNKYPKENWAEVDFINKDVKLVFGNIEKMKIAEKVHFKEVHDKQSHKTQLKVREVRVLAENGHQTAIVSTNYVANQESIASSMFARWCQENYLKYMTEHFDIDRLTDYTLQEVNDTSVVVSPEYKAIESQIRSIQNKINTMQRKLGVLTDKECEIKKEGKDINEIEAEKAEIITQIREQKNQLVDAKSTRKTKEKHIKIKDLPEGEKFKQLSSPGKHLTDFIKMISYRVETAMALKIRDWLPETKIQSDSRSILRGLFTSDADIIPDKENMILNIKIHTQSTPALNHLLKNLCDCLNEEPVYYPKTKYKLKYHPPM